MKESYYEALERINEKFPDELIPLKQAAVWLGMNQQQLQRTDCPFKKIGGRYFVSKTKLARWLS